MGFEAGVFQASPVVVAVSGVQGQVGRDVDAYACYRAEAHAADAVALVNGIVGILQSPVRNIGNNYFSFIF